MISPNNTTFPHICPVNSVGKASCETLKYLLLALIGLSTLENKKVLEVTAIGGSKSFCLFKKKKNQHKTLTLLHLPSKFIFLAKTLPGQIKF